MSRVYPLDDLSRVAEVRRAATSMANEEGLGETQVGHVAIIATEICTNLIKHAKLGEVFLATLSDRSRSGVEIVAVDRGPGMLDVAKCLRDGYSSSSTAGTGLGAIARLASEFDIYSEHGLGTVLVARVFARDGAPTSLGVVIKPMNGEEECGDAWAFRQDADSLCLMVADGLGHGPLASRASSAAVNTFRHSQSIAPAAILRSIHDALRSTRGAAVGVALIYQSAGSVQYAGIGNINGVIAGAGKPRVMVSHNGTAGYYLPRFQEFSYPLTSDAMVVMHSDGLHTNWNIEQHAGLRHRDPSIIAAVLYRDSARNRDDICVVVSKQKEAA